MRVTLWVAVLSTAVAAAEEHGAALRGRVQPSVTRAYLGQGAADQTERFSRRVKIARDGRFSVTNVAGDIVVTAGSGDEVSIEAVKRTRGDRRELANVTIEVDASANRVDVRTLYPSRNFRPAGPPRWNDRIRVDYTITVPASTEVEANSVSGDVKVTGVQSSVRAVSVSGSVTTAGTPRLELARSVSGNVDISDIVTDRPLTVGSINGTLRARNIKARSLEFSTVSGDMTVTDGTCERIDAKSISGNLEYSGSLARNGRYDFNSHSGGIRLMLPDSPGFVLSATSFSGSIRSDLPMAIGGEVDRNRRFRGRGVNSGSMQATYGDGSAVLTLRTFSGDIVISKR